MTRARHLLLAASLLGGLVMTAPASALPTGPAGLQAAPSASITQVRMMRGERMMMRERMMRRKMMRRRMMRRM